MLKITNNQVYKNNPEVLYYEFDYLLDLEQQQNEELNPQFRFFLDHEITKEQAIAFLEKSEEQILYFNTTKIIAHLLTEKLAERTILAPFTWYKLTKQEALVAMQAVNRYVSEEPIEEEENFDISAYLEANQPYEGHFTSFDDNSSSEYIQLTKNLEVLDFVDNGSELEVIFSLNKEYDERYVYVFAGEQELEVKLHERANRVMNQPQFNYYSFVISKSKSTKIQAKYKNGNLSIRRKNSIKKNHKDLYRIETNKFVYFTASYMFFFVNFSFAKKIKYELKYLRGIKNRDIAWQRIQILLTKPFIRNNKILVADRGVFAKDNGEAFYRYLLNNNIKNSYYILEEGSPDYDRLASEGFNILKKGSFKHKLYMYNYKLLCASNMAVDRYHYFTRKTYQYFSDLEVGDNVFLQHGISNNDISPIYNEYKSNISSFVCAAQKEYDFLKSLDFRNDLVNSGFPRFDNFSKEKNSNYILAFFTWRANLTSIFDDAATAGFEETDYFKQIYRVINDPDIISALKSKGLELKLFLHPNMQSDEKSFAGSDNYQLCNGTNSDITKLIRECKMLITDYSSVAFDIVYQNKPVIAYQFDQEDYHYESGISLESENLAKIYTDYELMKNNLLKYINNDFTVETEHTDAIDKFFGTRDQKNSERLYKYLEERYLK